MLSPKVKLHIHSIRVANGPDPQCMFNDTTKLFVRWSTCHHGCTHLEEHGTSEAHLGTHKWSQEDTKKSLIIIKVFQVFYQNYQEQ